MSNLPPPRPIRFTWNGQAMIPTMPGVAKRQFNKGETYLLETVPERSGQSHRHYFACLQDGWLNLPDHLAAHFPDAEHLRAYLLIKCGYYTTRTITCGDRKEALKVAAFVRPIDDFSIVTTNGNIVQVHTARSQSSRSMRRQEFQASKTKVLDALSEMLGTSTKALENNAKAVA